jgi:ABC-2 type transport system ATP-binding protein
MTAIEAAGVSRAFGDFMAVDGADLMVDRGEVVGLIGANGAGKTTLIRMILGLLQPSAGSIRLFGEQPSRDLRRRIGYVPQNLGLYKDLTAGENLAFRASAFGVSPAADGPRFGDQLVGHMSLGVQRRAAFAAATQHGPELLVLDEPTSGVSPLARSALWDAIHERAESGTAVLVSTHYMDEAEQADRVVMISRGRVVAVGSAAEIVGSHTIVEIRSPRWTDAFGVVDRGDRLVTLNGTAIRVVGEDAGALAGELQAAGIDADVRLAPATLEETLVEIES